MHISMIDTGGCLLSLLIISSLLSAAIEMLELLLSSKDEELLSME